MTALPVVEAKVGDMSAGESFSSAVAALSSALQSNTSLCTPFVEVFPIDGAAISTLGVPFGSETLCASNRQAARLDEIQIDFGEGPCWQAELTRRPVLTPDVRAESADAWPVFAAAIRDDDVRALHAFPLIIGSLSIGAIDLYSTKPGLLSDRHVSDASQLAIIVARQVLRRALTVQDKLRDPSGMGEDVSEFSRRIVHQATGMVVGQLDVSAEDALLIIRGHAFAHSRSVREIATEIVERRLDLAQRRSGVEN